MKRIMFTKEGEKEIQIHLSVENMELAMCAHVLHVKQIVIP